VDTGASLTCISPDVAQALNLRPIGMRPLVSATHVTPVNLYLIDLFIPFGPTAVLRDATQVAEFAPPPGSPFHILLGRDIICQGVLTI